MPRAREAGFTYLGMIVFVAILGLVGAATLKVEALLARAAAEQELLEAGAEFGAALDSYAAATAPGQNPVPPNLQALLKDPRFPGVRRHLRKIAIDPITGKAEWGITYLGDKVGVVAVYSLSEAAPLKVANFDVRFANFENKLHYSEWKFKTASQGQAAGSGDKPVRPGALPLTPLDKPPLVPPAPAPVPRAEPVERPEPPEAPEPPAEPETPDQPPAEPRRG